MKKLLAPAAVLLLSFGLTACGTIHKMMEKDPASVEFDKATDADEARVREDRTRTALRALESAVADYVKAEKAIPATLDPLVPKNLAGIPTLDIPACGGESDEVKVYPSDALRNGQVDGTRLKGTGHWGYVFNDRQVVVFVDCLKPTSKGAPWYQERGVH